MTTAIPPRTDSSVCTVSAGLTMQWQKEGRLLVFTWRSVSRDTIDDFARAYRTVLATWPVSEPLNQLNDLRFKGFAFTPYLRNTVQQVIKESMALGIRGRVANLMDPDIFMRVVQFFLRATRFTPGVHAELFADYDKAVAWLELP